MTSLTDHVDRLSAIAMSIRAAAVPPSHTTIPGPFARAILGTPLGDLIRDIDPSEIGLFTLVQPQQPAVPEGETANVGIGRIEFLGATPLRKPPSTKHVRADGQRPREHDPEVYAKAALKYLDRYQSIRPMPRASEQAVQLLDRLEEIRAKIQTLSDALKQHSSADATVPPLSPKSTIKEEERQIEDIQSRIQYLKERKAELAKKRSRAPLKAKREPKAPAPATPASPPDQREETFWNTPGAAARTLHFTGDSLLDEEMDMNDVSAASFGSLVVAQKGVVRALVLEDDSGVRQNPRSTEPTPDLRSEDSPQEDDEEDEVESVLDEDDDTAEPTVVYRKAPTPPLLPEQARSPSSPSEPHQDTADTAPAVTAPGITSATPHRPKVKVTTELERIVEKLWATVGEIIMPGHPFDALGKSTNKSKPPRAKETMAYLQELSNHAPTPTSPSASSFSSLSGTAPGGPNSAPTAQQVLTAHMLLMLLGASGYALTLRALKEALAGKAASIGAGGGASAGLLGGSAVTKPVYGCVAKRLLKIERGAGEQVVKFDL